MKHFEKVVATAGGKKYGVYYIRFKKLYMHIARNVKHPDCIFRCIRDRFFGSGVFIEIFLPF